MASLTGQLVAETYKALLKTIDNDILTASEKQITDGFGGGSNVFIDSQGFLRANKYKVTNGLATQFLKADGSLDSNTYLTGITSSQIISALGYTPVPTTRTLTINGTTYDLSANRSWTIDGTSAVWGNISGTLSNQTDLQNALNAKYNNPTGTISQYIRGDGSLATFPTLTGFVPYTGATANVDLGEFSLSAEYLAIDTDTTHSTDVGEIVWNPIDGTFDMGLLNGVVLQAGQELHFYGKASGAIGNGKAVMFAGVEGDHLLMSLADPATINANPQYFIGVATQDFANNDFGYVTILGKVRNLDTTAFTLGSVLYFDSANATDGLLTETQPIAPNAKIEVAAVVRVHATQGTLMVRPHIMPKMSMIQDVYIADPANNHGLFYDLANGYWENKSIASALGYTPQAQLDGTGFVKASGTTITYDNSTYLTTTDAASTYQRLDKMVSNLLASATEYPNSNAVINALALKADALNPVFTGYMTISGAEPKLYFTDTDQNPDYFIGADAGFFRIYDQTAGATRFVINSSGVTTIAGDLIVGTIAKSGGTATQFLKADGSIDSSTYVTSASLANYLLISTAASTYQRLDKMVSNLLASDTEYPNSNAVLAKLALKADAANPVFTGDMTISGIAPKLYFTDTDNNPDYTLFVDSGYFYIYDQTAGATKFQITPSGNAINTGTLTSASFIKSGGTSSQYLKADGSIDSNAYALASALGNYLPLTGGSLSGQLTFSSQGSKITFGDSTSTSPMMIGEGLVDTFGVDSDFMTMYFRNSFRVFSQLSEIGRFTSTGLRVYGSIIKDGGTSSQFLKADGSVDSNSYALASSLGNYLPLAGGTMSGILYGNGAGQFYIYNYARIGLPNAGRIIYNNGTGANMFFGEIAADVYGFTANLYSDTPTISMNVSSRRVGIGTATANAPLDVFSATTDSSSIQQWSYNGSPSSYRLQLNTIVSSGLVKYSFDMLNAGSTYNNNLVLDRGNVGIGTASPIIALSVRKDINDWIGQFKNYGSGAYGLQVDLSGSSGGLSAYALGIYTQVGTGFFVVNSGNTLVGTTTDAGYKFDVNGTSRFRNTLTFAGGDRKFECAESGGVAFYSNEINANAQGVTGSLYFGWRGTNTINVGVPMVAINYIKSTQFQTTASGSNTVYNLVDATNTYTGAYAIQAGAGSSGWGGSLTLYGHSHASRAGFVSAGISSGSNGKFTVMNAAIGAGSDVFTVDVSGNVLANGIITASGGINFISTVRMRWGGNNTPALGFPFGGSDTGNSLFIEAADGDTGGIAINNDGVTVYGAADTGFVFRAIDEDSYQSGVGLANATTFQVSQGTNGGGYLRGNFNIYNGSAYADAFYENSDFRLKTLIENNPIVDEIENLEAKLYIKNGKTELGYFAQDAEKLMPYAVSKDSDGFLSLSYREVHTAKIARLEQRVAELEKQLNLN